MQCQITHPPGDYAVVLELLFDSMMPMVDMIDSWLFEGCVRDPYDEFFVVELRFFLRLDCSPFFLRVSFEN